MNTAGNNDSANDNTNILLESLRYSSLLSNKKFEIDSNNNLHITEFSALKQRNDIIPLDLINPQPTFKKHLNKPLMILSLISILVSSAIVATSIIIGELWIIAFAIVFCIFGIGTLISSYKKKTNIYQYKFVNTETLLFSLSEPSTQNNQVKLFSNALNAKIINLNYKNENSDTPVLNRTSLKPLDLTLKDSNEIKQYIENKKSQYIKHLDFLFNHDIVDEALYQRLNRNIDKKIFDSENRFMTDETDTVYSQTIPDNIIKFPLNI